MIVKFYGEFKKICQTQNHIINVTEKKHIIEVIDLIIDEYGTELKNIIYNDSTISKKVLILVNNKNIYHQEGIETIVRDNDVVKILSVTAGG